MLKRIALLSALSLGLFLNGCGGHSNNSGPAPVVQPQQATISDPMNYIGTSYNGSFIDQNTPWPYERYDIGHFQQTMTFWTGPNTATTIWSYPPYGPFVSANGDGGETYVLNGDTAFATSTQDGSIPNTITHFSNWAIFDIYPPDCPTMKAIPQGRECKAKMTFSGSPNDITVDTIMSDHDDSPTQVERFYFGWGYGRLVWEYWQSQPCIQDVLKGRTGNISFEPPPYPNWYKCDERQSTNIGPATSGLSGITFNWPPK